jgi:N-acetylglucosaminyldiphosphoundecaprenol N-acetyl-beta-D-mannosaminyltransferase
MNTAWYLGIRNRVCGGAAVAARPSPQSAYNFQQSGVDAVVHGAMSDDLSREVHCILGMPVDALEMLAVVRRIEAAATSKTPFFISTPNLNFLVSSQSNPEFRETLLLSDLCSADGISIICIAWLIGIPINNRIAGCDIFDALKTQHDCAKPLKVFIFGGAEGVALAASRSLNAEPSGLCCVGAHYPGFGSVDEMSACDIIDSINSSGADLLVASLGAQKGQLWLQRNHHRLRVPVRTHLGALVNFEAGTLKRAPALVQKLGLEWLWRIKEEPHLWRRYWSDGRVLLHLLVTRVLPLAIWIRWLKLTSGRREQDLVITQHNGDESVTVSLAGSATAGHVDKIIAAFRDAIAVKKRIMIDFTDTRAIDARFLGLLLMIRKRLKDDGTGPVLIGLSPKLKRIFRLNGLEFLLSSDKAL